MMVGSVVVVVGVGVGVATAWMMAGVAVQRLPGPGVAGVDVAGVPLQTLGIVEAFEVVVAAAAVVVVVVVVTMP